MWLPTSHADLNWYVRAARGNASGLEVDGGEGQFLDGCAEIQQALMLGQWQKKSILTSSMLIRRGLWRRHRTHQRQGSWVGNRLRNHNPTP